MSPWIFSALNRLNTPKTTASDPETEVKAGVIVNVILCIVHTIRFLVFTRPGFAIIVTELKLCPCRSVSIDVDFTFYYFCGL